MNYTDYVRDPGRDCAVVAHRGIWCDAPENSLVAIEAAIRAGCNVVEIDVRRSADGGLFLLHDGTLQRMAGIDEAPEALSSARLAGITLRNRDGGESNEMTGERLPSLRQLFDLTRDRIFLHLDVKDRAIIPEVIACARDMGVAGQVDFWGSLRSSDDLAWIRETVSPHGVLFMAKSRIGAKHAKAELDLLFRLGPAICEVCFDHIEDIAALRARADPAGIALWANTLDSVAFAGFTDTAAIEDPDAIWGRLIEAGISLIQTDEPIALKSYLASRHG
ncbi:glycerophosphodiester phosphodiesterase family protein [Rhizobium viscosum]|uniref:Glycerophosphoryl diester phosphodiesterase n=1 Tax=Rhizobium viscosum TaxID=1673 RepID=A0ABR9J1S8_RHIVS|nr:glycerophosphodiester phosphodiesterase family protein [Rhizobium viscosum]MBE1509402.1 glycerophosphoryl diester phosphodiesterase [Rhizobium viscosum]